MWEAIRGAHVAKRGKPVRGRVFLFSRVIINCVVEEKKIEFKNHVEKPKQFRNELRYRAVVCTLDWIRSSRKQTLN